MPRAFITGVTGFVGGHLAAHLQANGCEVAGCDLAGGRVPAGVKFVPCDVLDGAGLAAALGSTAPAEVYHLAGMSFPPDADASPRGALEANLLGVVSLLDATRQACPAARVLLVGSAKEYGAADAAECVSDTSEPHPDNFYGITKYAAELIGRQYVRQFGMGVFFTRSFNHTGPGQSPRFVCSDWARQAAEISLAQRTPRLEVGDLSASIDFTDVRDVVRAYECILSRGTPGATYNVCSGTPVALRTVLELLVGMAGAQVDVVATPQRLRGHATARLLAADSSRLRGLGWAPAIPLAQTLADLFGYWKRQLAGGLQK